MSVSARIRTVLPAVIGRNHLFVVPLMIIVPNNDNRVVVWLMNIMSVTYTKFKRLPLGDLV